MRSRIILILFSMILLYLMSVLFPAPTVSGMTRTLKKEPAIVVVAFGTTTRARATYDFFEKQLLRELPEKYRGLRIEWAFTSEIIRERANRKFRKAGINRRYLSLAQVLANLEDEGYRKIAIQSLHIFPGQEFIEMEKVINAFRTLGLRIEYGGTLLHRWPWMHDTVNILEREFLGPDEGCNVLVTHGTPRTPVGSNIVYLGLARYLEQRYKNVFAGAVEGIITREEALSAAKNCRVKKVKFIPFMYVAGDHIMNDIMGSEPDDEGVPSWSMEMRDAGFEVDAVFMNYKGEQLYKGLGFYEDINRIFIRQLVKSLKKLES
jgi:sirohydrochlorin cobaltochelatase